MSWRSCPVCETRNPPRSSRCRSCAADFSDPDVRAMARANDSSAPELERAGSLASSRFLGISIDALSTDRGVGRLAIAGSAALLVGFVIPTAPGYDQLRWPWEMLSRGPALAVVFPAVAAVLGIGAAVVRRSTAPLGAAVLTALGLFGLIVCVPGLGELAGAPSKLLPLVAAGLAASGAALILRCVDPGARLPRAVLVAGAAATVVGLLIPLADAYRLLPAELRFFVDAESLGTAGPMSAYLAAFNRDPLVFFSSLYLMLPIALLPIATVVAWPRPGDHWDKSGLVLRPMAAVVVLYVPIGFALLLFNLVGLSDSSVVYYQGDVMSFDQFSRTLMIGRAKLLVLGGAFAMWAQLGTVVVLRARSDRNRTADRTRRTASESAAE